MNDNTAEGVAFKLLGLIGMAEGKNLDSVNSNADRKWILQTYAQCVKVVRDGWSADAAIKKRPLE